MRVWLRLLTVWFIAIALPVQGIAGVTMVHCGPSHERMAVSADEGHHKSAGRDAAVAHHHDADGAADEMTAVSDHTASSPSEAKGAHPLQLGKYKCSSCAACCAGAALPSAALQLPPAPVVATAFDGAVVTVDTFSSDGPERPPRTLLV